MLHEFLTANRADLVLRCRTMVAKRAAPGSREAELEHGISFFLDQLIKTLQIEQTSRPMQSRIVSGPAGGRPVSSEIGMAAKQHGTELLRSGFSVDQVVHDYGDLCQAITDTAYEKKAPIAVDEFRTLNRCLDNAIADAVTEFSYQSDQVIAGRGVQALNERLGTLAHELRNHIHTATLAVTAIRAGNVGLNGATGSVLDRSLIGLRTLIDRTLVEVRTTAGLPLQFQLLSVADFIAVVQISASLEAHARGCTLTISAVDPTLALDADRDLLFAAVENLLQNAFKFSLRHTEVALNVYAAGDRVRIEIEDRCGGLPPGATEKMFQPFHQHSPNKSGIGLGLTISRRSVESNHGTLTVRDLPGTGCVFTIDLPRKAMPSAA